MADADVLAVAAFPVRLSMMPLPAAKIGVPIAEPQSTPVCILV
jgi:hypothetical protein